MQGVKLIVRTALIRKSVVAEGAGIVDVRSIAEDGGVCIPVGVMPPDARPLLALHTHRVNVRHNQPRAPSAQVLRAYRMQATA